MFICLCFFKSCPLTSSVLQVRVKSPVEPRVIFTSANQTPVRKWLPPPLPRLHRLPYDPPTGGRDQKPPSPARGELCPQTSRRGRSCTPTSPPGSGWGRHPSTWPAPTPLAFPVFPVSSPPPGPSGVDAARTATPETESHVKVPTNHFLFRFDYINKKRVGKKNLCSVTNSWYLGK